MVWLNLAGDIVAVIALATGVVALRKIKRMTEFLEEMFTRQFADYTPNKAWSLFWEITADTPRRVWLQVADSKTRVRLTERPAGMVCEWTLSSFWPLEQGREVVVHVINVGATKRGEMPLSYMAKVVVQGSGVLPQTFDPDTGVARCHIGERPTAMRPPVFAEWAWKISRARRA